MPGQVLFIHVNLLAPVGSPDTIPISEATILAHLKTHGFAGEILGDFADRPLKPQVLARTVESDPPVAIGFTAYQENISQIRLWARFAKKLSPGSKVIIGGPQATFMPAEGLRHMPEVDFLCRGEGEEVMLGLVDSLSKKKDPAEVPGLCFFQGDHFVETGPAYGAKDLDDYPSPYLTGLIDLQHKERAVLLTSRGCSYQCAFCYTPKASHRKVRFYSIERTIQEMQYLKSKGIGAFWFADPNFSCSRNRLVTLLEAMIREVPDITFWCQTRYDLMDEELLSLLRTAGADHVAYGLESANPDVLKKINKPIDLRRLSRVIRLTQEAGIQVELFSMFALPGETFDQALNTLKFVQQHQVAIDGNSISQQAHQFFGTPMNDDPAAYGIRPFRRTRPAYLSVCRDYETDAMPAKDIQRMGLIWRISRSDFAEDVTGERNLFHRASLITQNREALAGRPEASFFLTRIYLILEEYKAALNCMAVALKAFPEDPLIRQLVDGPFTCFRLTPHNPREGCKVIFDCQGSVNGQLVPATCGRFQEATIGRGLLLPEFERQFCGMVQGGCGHFEVAFPKQYGLQALAGKRVTFRTHLCAVLEPVSVKNRQALGEDGLQNDYPLQDSESLRQHNIHLYYKIVDQHRRCGRPIDTKDALIMANLYLKLGFLDRATAMAERLSGNPITLTHAAHVFRVNGRPETALDFLGRATQDGPRERLIRAQALFDLERFEEAEGMLTDLTVPDNTQAAELRVQLAGRLCLPVNVYLEREEALLDERLKRMV